MKHKKLTILLNEEVERGIQQYVLQGLDVKSSVYPVGRSLNILRNPMDTAMIPEVGIPHSLGEVIEYAPKLDVIDSMYQDNNGSLFVYEGLEDGNPDLANAHIVVDASLEGRTLQLDVEEADSESYRVAMDSMYETIGKRIDEVQSSTEAKFRLKLLKEDVWRIKEE